MTGKGIKEPKGKRLAREKRRARFERELHHYSIETYNALRIARALGKRVVDQPHYMPELRALYMAVRETHKGGMAKGETVDHQWPREVGAKRRGVASQRQAARSCITSRR